MDNKLRLLINIVAVVASSFVGALLIMGLDGGTRRLEFLLYVLFFASISSPAFSPRYSCSVMLRRVSKSR